MNITRGTNEVRPDGVERGENHVSRKSVWPSNSDVAQMEFHGWRGTTNEIKVRRPSTVIMNLLNTVYTLGDTEIERPCFPYLDQQSRLRDLSFAPSSFASNFISTKILIEQARVFVFLKRYSPTRNFRFNDKVLILFQREKQSGRKIDSPITWIFFDPFEISIFRSNLSPDSKVEDI